MTLPTNNLASVTDSNMQLVPSAASRGIAEKFESTHTPYCLYDDGQHQHEMELREDELHPNAPSMRYVPKSPTSVPASTKKSPAKHYVKAPNAPKRFKPAFIFFSAVKHKEIRAQLGDISSTKSTAKISKLVSEAWKRLSPEDRSKWEVMASEDKTRYYMEKSLYTGPWRVPKQRKSKDANAPKRPMSAFLAYANCRRAEVKSQMPEASNGDISRTLSVMWKEATEDVRQRYIEEESEKRQAYLAAMTEWKKKNQEESVKQNQEAATQLPSVKGVQEARNWVRENQPDALVEARFYDLAGAAERDHLTLNMQHQACGQGFPRSTITPFYDEQQAMMKRCLTPCEQQQQPLVSFFNNDRAGNLLSQGSLPLNHFPNLHLTNRNDNQNACYYRSSTTNPLMSSINTGSNQFGNQQQLFSGVHQGLTVPGTNNNWSNSYELPAAAGTLSNSMSGASKIFHEATTITTSTTAYHPGMALSTQSLCASNGWLSMGLPDQQDIGTGNSGDFQERATTTPYLHYKRNFNHDGSSFLTTSAGPSQRFEPPQQANHLALFPGFKSDLM